MLCCARAVHEKTILEKFLSSGAMYRNVDLALFQLGQNQLYIKINGNTREPNNHGLIERFMVGIRHRHNDWKREHHIVSYYQLLIGVPFFYVED